MGQGSRVSPPLPPHHLQRHELESWFWMIASDILGESTLSLDQGHLLSPEGQLVAGLGYILQGLVLGRWAGSTLLSPRGLTLVFPRWRKTSNLISTLLAEHTIWAASPRIRTSSAGSSVTVGGPGTTEAGEATHEHSGQSCCSAPCHGPGYWPGPPPRSHPKSWGAPLMLQFPRHQVLSSKETLKSHFPPSPPLPASPPSLLWTPAAATRKVSLFPSDPHSSQSEHWRREIGSGLSPVPIFSGFLSLSE